MRSTSSNNSEKNRALQDAISGCGSSKESLQAFVRELVAGLSAMDQDGHENLLDMFIAELVLSAADERRRIERKQKQAETVAAAKARGVRFGRQPAALPDDFDEYYQAWRDGEISLREAADSCNMARATFKRAVFRKEQGAAGYAVQ